MPFPAHWMAPLSPSPAELEAMLQRVLAAGKKTGTPVGLHVQSTDDVQEEKRWQD